jgi:hypothetical protein
MSPRFRFTKATLLVAAASIGLLALPSLASAQPGGPGDQGQAVPYAGGGQPSDSEYGPPPPPPPPPPPGAYMPNDRGPNDGGPNDSGSNYAAPSYGGPNYGGPSYGGQGAAAQGYAGRDAGPNSEPGFRDPSRGRCQMVEDRVFYPDGTTESSSVQACRDRRGHWHLMD